MVLGYEKGLSKKIFKSEIYTFESVPPSLYFAQFIDALWRAQSRKDIKSWKQDKSTLRYEV